MFRHLHVQPVIIVWVKDPRQMIHLRKFHFFLSKLSQQTQEPLGFHLFVLHILTYSFTCFNLCFLYNLYIYLFIYYLFIYIYILGQSYIHHTEKRRLPTVAPLRSYCQENLLSGLASMGTLSVKTKDF